MSMIQVPYWHLGVDQDGVTRMTRRFVAAAPSGKKWHGIGRIASSQPFGEVNQQQLIVLQPGDFYGWHENPFPQWIVPLCGAWFVETLDGGRVEMGPGELCFGEDQGSRSSGGRQGHQSGVVGDEPCVLLLIQNNPARTTGETGTTA